MESDSSQNSLADNLDEIGRFPSINLTQYLNTPSFNFPNLPSLQNLPRIKSFHEEVSNYIANYVRSIKDDESIASIKTAISTRIQMNNFLTDLKLGFTFDTAIDRLEALKDIVHETIILPVEGEFESGFLEKNRDISESTEPKGVQEAEIRKFQPLVNDLINPEKVPRNGNSSYHNNTLNHHLRLKHKRKKKIDRRLSLVLSDESTQPGSDLDHVEELSASEVKTLTDLNNKDDFGNEKLLREKIQQIQSLENVSQKLKSKLVTRLMMGNYYKYVNEALPAKVQRLVFEETLDPNLNHEDEDEIEDERGGELLVENDNLSESSSINDNGTDIEMDEDQDSEVFLTEEDLIPTYTNESKTIMGCSHYQRNCKLECPTCKKWFTCRFCHDEQVTSHKLVRNGVKHILCMFCQTPQEPRDNDCAECGKELANYFCSKCVLFDNDPTKDIYHCEKCGICRLGLGLGKDYFHCDTCNICLSIDLKSRHKCLLNSTHCNCPICNEYLFNSIQKVVFMKCGHLIHQQCFAQMSTHSYKCPLCKTSVIDMETQFRILDLEILELPLPMPYKFWRCIVSCNDCKGKSNVPYHVLGLKCEYCKSYNTNQHKLIKPEEDDVDDIDLSAERLLRTENAMRLMATNLSSNFNIVGQNSTPDDGYTESGYESTNMNEGARKGQTINRKRRDTKSSIGSSKSRNNSVTESSNSTLYKSKADNKPLQSPAEDSDEDFEKYRNGNLLDLTSLHLHVNHDGQDQSYIASVLQGFINRVLRDN